MRDPEFDRRADELDRAIADLRLAEDAARWRRCRPDQLLVEVQVDDDPAVAEALRQLRAIARTYEVAITLDGDEFDDCQETM
jgi:hypothetical protein